MTAPRVVVTGVSGAGKSTVGKLLATDLGVPFLDGDSLHPAANIAALSAGVALTDDDRAPWLYAISAALSGAGHGLVVACSALKRDYRDRILAAAPSTGFVMLSGSRQLLDERLRCRSGHFSSVSLLDSQLATLEPLEPDEPGIVIDIGAPLAQVAAAASAYAAGRCIGF